MRVLQVVTQLEPAGAQRVAEWLRAGISMSSSSETVNAYLYVKAETDFADNPKLLCKTRPGTPLAAMKMIWRLRGLIKEEAPDVIIAHTHYAMMAVDIITAFSKRPKVFVHHWPVARYPLVCRAWLASRRFLPGKAKHVFVAEHLDDGNVATDPIYLPNPAVPPTVALAEDCALSADYCHDVDILVVARHSREKDLSTVVKALALSPGRRATFAGSGPDTQELMDLASDLDVDSQITFLGRVASQKVQELLASCNVLVQPSLWEAMPMSVLEACATDTNIIVSDIDAHGIFLRYGAAVGFDVQDEGALANALASVESGNVDDCLEIGRMTIRELHSEERILSDWRHLLRSVVRP